LCVVISLLSIKQILVYIACLLLYSTLLKGEIRAWREGNTIIPPSKDKNCNNYSIVFDRFQRCAYTLNNYTESEVKLHKKLSELPAIHCHVFGKEVGKNGTRHLQGYIESSSAKNFLTWKKLLGQRAHVEAAKESREKNYVYCTKEDKEPYIYEGMGFTGWSKPVAVGYPALCEAINAG